MTRCYTQGCGKFATTPEGHGDPTKISTFPECGTCLRDRKLRDRRAANLMRNLADDRN